MWQLHVQNDLGTNVSTSVVYFGTGPTMRLSVRFNASSVAFVLNISDAGLFLSIYGSCYI